MLHVGQQRPYSNQLLLPASSSFCVCCCAPSDTAIKDNMLFSGLPPAGLAAIIDSMQPQMATAGKEIIKQVRLSPLSRRGCRASNVACVTASQLRHTPPSTSYTS